MDAGDQGGGDQGGGAPAPAGAAVPEAAALVVGEAGELHSGDAVWIQASAIDPSRAGYVRAEFQQLDRHAGIVVASCQVAQLGGPESVRR